MHWNGILKAHTPSVLKQSGLKCFRDAPPVPFYLAHCCFIKEVLVCLPKIYILYSYLPKTYIRPVLMSLLTAIFIILSTWLYN